MRGGAAGEDDRDLTANQIGCQSRQSVILTVRLAVIDRDVSVAALAADDAGVPPVATISAT
jgi:hypothetical protein